MIVRDYSIQHSSKGRLYHKDILKTPFKKPGSVGFISNNFFISFLFSRYYFYTNKNNKAYNDRSL